MPSELGADDMVSKQDDGTSGDSQDETEITLLDNTTPEESNVLSQDTENEETTTRNDNYVYNNVNETRNLDNTMLSCNQESNNFENLPVDCEARSVQNERIMENDAHNTSVQISRCETETESPIESLTVDSLHSPDTIDNTTQTCLQDTQPINSTQPVKIENSKKNFTRCIENSGNKASNQGGVTNASSVIENGVESLRVEDTIEMNNLVQNSNGIDTLSSLDSPITSDNITDASLHDTRAIKIQQSSKKEPLKKNFTKYLENNVNSSGNLQSTSDYNSLYSTNQLNDNESEDNKSCDVRDGATCLPLQIPVTDSASGEGSSTCDDDIVMVNSNKPFKLPSLVNLYEAAEAQRAELEDQDALNAMSSTESEMFAGSESSNSDPESQQASSVCRSKKVCY